MLNTVYISHNTGYTCANEMQIQRTPLAIAIHLKKAVLVLHHAVFLDSLPAKVCSEEMKV